MKFSLPAYLLAASAAAKKRDVFHARNTANQGLRRRVQHAAEMDSLPEELDLSMSLDYSRFDSHPQFYDLHEGYGEVKAFGPGGICSEGDSYETLDLTQAFQPLRKPTQVYPDEDGVTRVTMKFEPINYHGPSFSNIIRSWNGEAPGPTLHLQPGGSLEIELINCQRRPDGPYQGLWKNDYAAPNTTNIHTHGPHISGESPGDNVFVNLGPENMTIYKYHFDENHFPGTFWYHPHFHGSTALQVGQGAAGMMIIEDNELYPVPDMVKNMEDIQMVVQHMNLARLQDASRTSKDEVTKWTTDSTLEDDPFTLTNITTDLTNFMLINMQFIPEITMEVGKWYRWRMAMSSIEEGIAFNVDGTSCQMKLLAKDSIYVSDAPRDISMVILSPGNRADVAVRCDSVGPQYVNVTKDSCDLFARTGSNGNFCPDEIDGFNSTTGQFDPNRPAAIYPENPTPDMLVGSFSNPEAQPTILVIKVVAPKNDIPDFGGALNKPCYLVDLFGDNVTDMFKEGREAENNTFTNKYSCNSRDNVPGYKDQNDAPDKLERAGVCGVGGPYGIGGITTNVTYEEAFENGGLIPFVNKDTYINDFDTGTVQQITYSPAQFHPYHQHVNPYQIFKIENSTELPDFVSEYYKVGDWHDTLQFPSNEDTDVTFRFQADQFTGHMVQHCHLLFHEDLGMMSQYDITGKEGATWDYARVIDPQCVLPKGKSGKSGKK